MASSGQVVKRAKKLEFKRPIKNQVSNAGAVELHERIAVRAFEMFERGGKIDGRDWEDWFRAEREILGTRTQMDADVR